MYLDENLSYGKDFSVVTKKPGSKNFKNSMQSRILILATFPFMNASKEHHLNCKLRNATNLFSRVTTDRFQ